MNKKVLVVNYKTGNIDSVVKAVKLNGFEPIYSSRVSDLNKASKIILPGQGSYENAINNLKNTEIYPHILEKINKENIFVLGICVGMQILSSFGYESKNKTKQPGLNLVEGEVKKLKESPSKLPHIGWSGVFIENLKDKIFLKIENSKDFYFIHSYGFKCNKEESVLATSFYNQKFCSIIKNKSVYGFQFHPEKSLKNGIKILNNFLNLK